MTLFTAFTLGALRLLLIGWALMISVGVVRAEWLPDLPTIGFGPALVVSAWLSALVGRLTASNGSGE